jgi:hypothetical protein
VESGEDGCGVTLEQLKLKLYPVIARSKAYCVGASTRLSISDYQQVVPVRLLIDTRALSEPALAFYHPWCYTKTELTALLEAQEAEMIKDCEEFEV